jgi:hypothetical protein
MILGSFLKRLGGPLQRHVILTFIGVMIAIGLVAWVQPANAGGTAFLVVITLLAVNALGAIIVWLLRGKTTPPPAA